MLLGLDHVQDRTVRRDGGTIGIVQISCHPGDDPGFSDIEHHAVEDPRKGVIAVGSDADFAIWDPGKIVTISRGELIYADGQVTSNAGRGRFLRCDRPFAHKPDPAPILTW